jgi:hypothetical protein
MTDTAISNDVIRQDGTPVGVDAVEVQGKTFLITGGLVRTARLKYDWQEDVEKPGEVIEALKRSPTRIDLLRFWQRLPETAPKYQFYKEWREVAAIPITTYQNWWDKQVNPNTRRLIRKSEKAGVAISEVALDDRLVNGIRDIFNECPIRRGKPFRHYGKDFDTVKSEMSLDLPDSIFIAATFEGELIGFVKLLFTDRYAMVTMILDKQSHRERSPVNGLVAKSVQICAERKFPYLTYTLWRRGGHGYFQERNGFEKIPVPEYYVPLTSKGRLVLRMKLHEGVKGWIPEALMIRLLAVRSRWYSKKFGHTISSTTLASRRWRTRKLSVS